MKFFNFVITSLILCTQTNAFTEKDIVKKTIGGLDFVFLPDDRFPTYDLTIYFSDGALSDKKKGTTEAMFSLLDAGTRRYSQKDISDTLEYFGAGHGANVTHEYSTYSLSGLVKDFVPSLKMICHLFHDATYPKNELKKEKRRAIESIRNSVTNHSSLARRVFRELSMSPSPFSYPVGGKIRDIKKIYSKDLKSHLEYFNSKVKKTIYITGPEKVLGMTDILSKECGWGKETETFVRNVDFKLKERPKKKIYLVTVPKANQAQVRIGRIFDQEESRSQDKLTFASDFLAGGFTAILMRELRDRRGLTYTVGAIGGSQRFYGRSVLSTFTKNESLPELLTVVKDSLDRTKNGDFTKANMDLSRGRLIGSYPFQFEQSSSFLGQIMALDHNRDSYSRLFNFRENIQALSKEDLQKAIGQFYNWDEQTIVIVGSKKLAKELKKFGEVKIYSYKKFL